MRKYYLTIFVICLLFRTIYSMSEAQMKSTGKLMRNVCQPKTKVSNDQIEKMHNGDFSDTDSKPKCYMLCVLQTMKVVKNGQIDYELSLKQLHTLPSRYQEPTRGAIEDCKNLHHSDQCEFAYMVAKCMYDHDPEYYFLP